MRFTKKYYALVHGIPGQKSGILKSYLSENKFLRIYASPKPSPDAKLSITHYQVLKEGEKKSLLEVTLETGRKHQIRVHMAGIGHPIVGDDKYGGQFRDKPKKGPQKVPGTFLGLQAFSLEIEHPRTHRKMKFEIPPLAEFKTILPNA